MTRSNLTWVLVSLGLWSAGSMGCTPAEAPKPTLTVQPVKRAVEDAHAGDEPREDAATELVADAGDDREEEDRQPKRLEPDAAKAKADAATRDAGPDAGRARDAGQRADAGDAGDAGDPCGAYVELENSPADLFECEQFKSDDCASYADEVCQEFHAFRDHQVFEAFVSCVADTPGLDLCDADLSTVKDCAVEAKSKACRAQEPACEAYQGCETLSVDDCNEAVESLSASTVEVFGDVYACDVSPTYFIE